MMNLIQIIKRAAVDAVEQSGPTTAVYGTVTKTNPLEVNIEQRLTLTRDFLIVPEGLTRKEIDLSHSHQYSNGSTGEALQEKIVIREGLGVGDRVLLLRILGGQKYVILDRLVSA